MSRSSKVSIVTQPFFKVNEIISGIHTVYIPSYLVDYKLLNNVDLLFKKFLFKKQVLRYSLTFNTYLDQL